MSGYSRQMQTKVAENTYWQVEARAQERGITTSEFLRDLVERECGRPARVTLGQRLTIEILLELRTLLVEFIARFLSTDSGGIEEATTQVAGHARGEAERRIREAASREGTKSC